MLKKLFGIRERKTEESLLSPLNGKVIGIEEVPDPTFADKMMGEGIAIEPTEGKVVSPVNGKILNIFPTKHAIGIEGESGIEVLIHIGLETVAMNGEGFETHVTSGDNVKAGDLLITFDLELVKEKAKSTITPVVITNSDKIELIEHFTTEDAQAGQTEIVKIMVKP